MFRRPNTFNLLQTPQVPGFSGAAQLNGNIYAARNAAMGDMLSFLGFKAFFIPTGTSGVQWLWQFGSYKDEDTNLQHGCICYMTKGVNNKWAMTMQATKINTFFPPDRYSYTEVFFARSQSGLNQHIIEENKWYSIYFEANFDDFNTGYIALADQVSSGSYNLTPFNIITNTSGTGEATTGLGTDAFDAQVDLATSQAYSKSTIATYGGFFDNAYQGSGPPERTFIDGSGWIKQVINPLGYQSAIEPNYNARYYSHVGYTPQYTVYGGQVPTYIPPPLLAK